MARPYKQGLDNFMIDVNLYHDRKIRRLLKSNGINAITVYISLLCRIYSKRGYFIPYDKYLCFDVADQFGIGVNEIKNIISNCLEYGLFDKSKFDNFKILTSVEIQKQFVSSTRRRREPVIIGHYRVFECNNSMKGGDK